MGEIRAFLARFAAVALLTIREITRRKFFIVLILFTLGLLSVFALAPGLDPNSTLRVMLTWIFRATTIFLAILAVFIAGTSLPLDIERRQIYALASKPIAKPTILLGKFGGFAVVLLLSLAGLGMISILMLRGAQLAFTFGDSKPGAPKSFPLESWPRLAGEFVWTEAHKSEYQGTRPEEARRFRLRGESLEGRFRYRFSGLSPGRFNMNIPCRLKFTASGESMYDFSVNLRLVVINPETDARQEIACPQTLNNEWYRPPQDIPRTFISSGGELWLEVYRAEPVGAIVADRDRISRQQEGVFIYEAPELFELTLVKALLMVFIEGLFLLAVVVASSSILSGPVTLFLGISIFFVCSVYGFLSDSVRDVEQTLEYLERSEHAGHGHREAELPSWLMRISSAISKGVLGAVPDFRSLDPTPYLLDDVAIPLRALVGGMGSVIIHIVISLALGCLSIRLRDLT